MSNPLRIHLYIPFELWARLSIRKRPAQSKWGVIEELLDSEEKQTTTVTELSQERYELRERIKKTEATLKITNDMVKLLVTRLAQYEDTSSLEHLMK